MKEGSGMVYHCILPGGKSYKYHMLLQN